MQTVLELLKLVAFCVTGLAALFLVLLALPGSRMGAYCLRALSLSLWAIVTMLGLYVLSPVDILPDFIPLIGQVDDAAAIIAALFAGVTAWIAWSTASANLIALDSSDAQRKQEKLRVANSANQLEHSRKRLSARVLPTGQSRVGK